MPMWKRRTDRDERPLPPDFLRWQVRLRRHTMEERHGSPHAGVAPLLSVRRPGRMPPVTTHSIICGILPAADRLQESTDSFRRLYEESIPEGARDTFDRGLQHLRDSYDDPSSFDPSSLTTMLGQDSEAIVALRAEPRCSLIFYVFDLEDKTEIGRFRCLQLDCRAELHTRGPVFDNVWWHNTLFHGKMDDAVVVRFGHRRTFDTRFGGLEAVG